MIVSSNISASKPDWHREEVQSGRYEPGKRLLAVIRQYQRHRQAWYFFLLRPFLVLRHRLWSAVSGADIPLNSSIGGGLLLPHPTGVVIHPEATIGVNCLILQQVTIGTGSLPGVPDIGGHVDIGAGAKILGGVKVGDHARIGANAVVVSNIPAGATAIGIPARVRGGVHQ